MKLPPGTNLGRYRIEKYINEGGMQQVYSAVDSLLGRRVAIKTPKNDDGERRFDRSAHLSAQVSHANVARTLDYFEFEGNRFLVEEFVDGIDVGALLKKVPRLDSYVAARIVHGLARGIAAVHAVDVVHRDLKPSNIIAEGGLLLSGIKVTDFGVAKMAGAEIDASVEGGALTLTGSKTLIGHLPYLAPEILRKRATVDAAADIWAVGALAFHLISGEPPFGYELADVVTKILAAPVPPLPDVVASNSQLGGLARELYGVAVRCLQRDPKDRPTARQLLDLCERLCYPITAREVGVVTAYPANSFGFAAADAGSVFFHVDSVYGPSLPRLGGKIWFSRHSGQPRDRAHPVVPIFEG